MFPNQATANLNPGEHVFLIQGKPDDPASARAMVNTVVAVNTPVEESLFRIENLNRAAINAAVIDQHRTTTQDAPSIRLG